MHRQPTILKHKFRERPLGFRVEDRHHDGETKVTEVLDARLTEKGLESDSRIVQVGKTDVEGKSYSEILGLLKSQELPLRITFELPTLTRRTITRVPGNLPKYTYGTEWELTRLPEEPDIAGE